MPLDLVGLESTYPAGQGEFSESSPQSLVCNNSSIIMGRWKRKKEAKQENKKLRGAATAGGDDNGRSRAVGVAQLLEVNGGDTSGVVGVEEEDDDDKMRDCWTWQERSDLSRYLDEYRIGCCEQFLNRPLQSSKASQQQEQHEHVLIGGYLFPALTEKVFQRPYLELPHNLTSKHRRIIHEVCLEAMLFHMTVNTTSLQDDDVTTTTCTLPVSLEQSDDNKNDEEDSPQLNENEIDCNKTASSGGGSSRYIVISIYADGFDSIPECQDCNNEANHQQLQGWKNILQYKPWYCRKERHHEMEDNNNNNTGNNECSTSSSCITAVMVAKARNDIDHLMDQPSECLREGQDEINFEKWDGQDLSTMSPPTCNENENDTNSSSSSWLLVDSVDKMQQFIAELQQALPMIRELGFDLEAYNPSKYAQVTCLLQITTNLGRDYVIDTLAPGVWDMIGPGLAPLFANANIVKVGHSIGGLDIRCLHRDFGILVVNVFDTYEASKVLHLSSHGLASVCAHYGLLLHENEEYTHLKAIYQTCDWRRRPLTVPMILYGRYDVHYLLLLRHLMMRDLTRQDLWDTTPVQHDATSRLVAAALQKTLAQFAQEDDEDDYYHDNEYSNNNNNNDNELDNENENPDKPNPNEAKDSITDDVPPPDTAAIGAQEEENDSNDASVQDSDNEDGDGNDAFYTPKGSIRSLGTGQFGGIEDCDDGGSQLFRMPWGEHGVYVDDDDLETSGKSNDNRTEENDSGENDDAIVDEEYGNDREPIASVPVLRLQPRLMAVLSQSQERCRDLWSGRSEPASNTRTLLNIQRRAKQQRIRQNNKKRRRKSNGSTTPEEEKSIHQLPDWMEQNDKLYHALVAWRDQVAREWEVLPGLVIPLDMLVPIAWQCPQTRVELQRIRFDLPGICIYNDGQYMNELLDLVKRHFPLTEPTDHDGNEKGNTSMIYLYANRASAAEPKLPPPPIEENDKPHDTNGLTISDAVTSDDINNVVNGHENDMVKDEKQAPPAIDVHVDQDPPSAMPAAAAARSSSALPAATTVTIPTTKSPPADKDDNDELGGEVDEDSVYRWHRVAWIVAGVAVIVLIAVRTTASSRSSDHRGHC